MRHKPWLGSHLFLELDKTNGSFLPEQNGSKSDVVGFETNKSSGSFDAFRKPNKQKQCYTVHTKDVNQLGGNGHVEKVKCTPDIRSRTPKIEKIPTSRSFDDEINKGAFRDNGTASRGHHRARSIWKKYDTEHVSRAKLGSERHASKPVLKHVESKTVKIAGKKNPTFNADGISDHSEEGSKPSPTSIKRRKGFHARASPSCSEAKRQRGSSYAQETSSNEDTHLGSQSSPESERNTHGNHVLGTPRHINGTEGLQVRKSSRVPKKRIFDDDEDEPVRKQRKRIFDDEEETIRKQRKWLQAECTAGHSLNAGHDEEMDMAGDEIDYTEKKCDNQHESFEPCVHEELPLTARQRALRLSKEGGELSNGNNVEFPDGLQPVLQRKQKEGISEAEQAIKKEEAAKRRKQQMEKNAKEIQASAIQKILGQESSRKKREEKLQKQREEIEQEKQAALMAPAVNSIRWVMGPSGNSVSFSRDVELPKIFSGPCSYPREREKCAGPSCNNAYKYRDAKTRLPLCSLQCYRAVQDLPSAVC